LFNNAALLDQISYYDAIELAFFGAQVIHPKTIQPLQNKTIPLKVKSFLKPEDKGTLVSVDAVKINIPVVIIKENQVLLSIKTKDLAFVDEKNLSNIFEILSAHNAKVNMMQNGAVSFSIVIDFLHRSFDHLLSELTREFEVRYNKDLRLITIRHYTKHKIEELLGDKKVFLEQKSRNTAQFLISST
jgi:aspartate kinase